MRIFVIADTHFGHKALINIYESRPVDFEKRIEKSWIRIVDKDDLVIHLGDVIVGKSADWASIIPNLPGRKILVLGNHDKKSESWYIENGFDFCCLSFTWQMYGLRIIFSHEPTMEGVFDLNIHGHLHLERHSEYVTDKRHYLISLEKSGYQPLTLDYIVRDWMKQNNISGYE